MYNHFGLCCGERRVRELHGFHLDNWTTQKQQSGSLCIEWLIVVRTMLIRATMDIYDEAKVVRCILEAMLLCYHSIFPLIRCDKRCYIFFNLCCGERRKTFGSLDHSQATKWLNMHWMTHCCEKYFDKTNHGYIVCNILLGKKDCFMGKLRLRHHVGLFVNGHISLKVRHFVYVELVRS